MDEGKDVHVLIYNSKFNSPIPVIPFHMLTLLQGVLEFPLPAPYLPTNFNNSVGLRYEAMEVKACLDSNRKESEIMPLSHTQITMEIMEDVLKQLGSAVVR